MGDSTVTRAPIVRLMEKVAKQPGGCWLFTGASLHHFGYGRVRIPGRHLMAHRVSYERYIGPIPPGLSVLHRCDVPACVNPDHLFLGTQRDNLLDCAAKGRFAPRFGEHHPHARLTAELVRRIRANIAGWSDSAWARFLNVTPPTVRFARLGRTWRHVQ